MTFQYPEVTVRNGELQDGFDLDGVPGAGEDDARIRVSGEKSWNRQLP